MNTINIEEIVRHPIQLEKVELSKVSIENSGRASEFDKLDINIEINGHGEIINEQKGKAILEVRVVGSSEGEQVYELYIKYQGICVKNDNASKNVFMNFLQVQSVQLLWPYMREAIPSFMIKMDIEPIKIPTIDVIRTAKKMNNCETED